MEFKISKGVTEDSKQLRIEVFVDEQGFEEEFDDIDDIAFHIVCHQDNIAVATGRTFKKDDTTYKIGRVAVKKDYRGKDFGLNVMKKVEETAKQQGATKTALSSQYHAKDFYIKCGYEIVGEPYLEENVKHIYMEKSL